MRYCIKMRVSLAKFLLLLVCIPGCSSKKENFADFDFSIERSISFDNEFFSIHDLKFQLSSDSLVYGYDMAKAVVFKFDNKGNLLNQNRFQEGENSIDLLVIGDVYPVNNDSIFVVEQAYDHLLLLAGD